MLDRWIAGDRAGLAYRPADPAHSRHVPDANGVCRAFDVGNSVEWCQRVGAWVTKAIPWATWGGVWVPPDTKHFEVDDDSRWVPVISWRI